jgi:predicted  nucleic acid-binding Zn-ribbon protein
VTDIPDNVDLQWIARHLVELRDDLRAMRDDLNVIAWSVVRIDRNLEQLRNETQRLWLEFGDLRRRVERLEAK